MCDFCKGRIMPGEMTGSGGYRNVKSMINAFSASFGIEAKEPEECCNAIQLQGGNKLVFDNSAREYSLLGVEIKYCPFCGVDLAGNTQDKTVYAYVPLKEPKEGE